ncbi:MAG: DUF4292 domain-containing protein [Parabacteroides sp.]|nr:DUF4292 domain-containing protein [Parabacteroides sp.]MBQ8531765.1 DUF4292 domain-containing protein [Parabacteroides sp.]
MNYKDSFKSRFTSWFISIGFIVFIFSLSGCKSSKKVAVLERGSEKTQKEFFTQMQEQAFQFETLTARLNVDLDLPGNTMSSRVDLKMIKDSAFQLSVVPFLGIEVFRAEISVDSVKILDRMNKRYVAENYANLKGQTPIEFNFYNLQALLTNQLFLPGQKEIKPKQYSRFQLTQEGSAAEIQVKDAIGLLYTFMADGEEKILSTRVTDSSEHYALQWNYLSFRQTEGQFFPMKMDIQLQKDGASQGGIVLNFSHMQTNVPVKMDFSIPSKYTRITLAQIMKSLSKNKK